MFIDLKFSTFKIKSLWIIQTNGKFSFFHSVKPGLTKRVLLVWMEYVLLSHIADPRTRQNGVAGILTIFCETSPKDGREI